MKNLLVAFKKHSKKDMKIILVNINMERIKQIQEQIANHLGIEVLPIKYQNIEPDDSRLYAKEGFVAINEKYTNNELETIKSIAHEYRHAFQIYYASLMKDKLSQIWREELAVAKTGEDSGYLGQALELDAFAFTKWYLAKYLGIEIVHPDAEYERVIQAYLARYEGIM